MKIVKQWGVAVAAVCILASCGSPVYVQKDESAYLAKYNKTYAWVQTRSDQDDNKNVTAFADEAVHNAVKAALAEEGWAETNGNAGILIGYDILVERTTEQRSEPVYSQPFTRVYYNPYLRRWGTVNYPSQFVGYDTYSVASRQATLTISMMDAASDKTVWQAWSTERIDGSKLTGDDIGKSVQNIFKKFDAGK